MKHTLIFLLKLLSCNVLRIIGLVSVVLFSSVWGYLALGSTALDSYNLKWLWGDLAQVYTAWSQYLSDPNSTWLSTTRLSQPLPLSVSLFDPMPVILLLAQPFVWIVSERQQFFGYYFFGCLVLQGVFGYLSTLKVLALVGEKRVFLSVYTAVIVGILFASIPYTLFRFQGHTALSSQWVLALSIWVTLSTLASSRFRWISANGFVQFLATGLNPYLALMVLISNSLMVLLKWRTLGIKEVVLRVPLLFIVAFFGLAVFGFIGAAAISPGGYGVYSMNVLGPLDSNGLSGLLSLDIRDPTGGQSFEGFIYLGLGILLIIGLAFGSIFNFRTPKNSDSMLSNGFPFVPSILITITFYLLALSTTITVSLYTLNLPVPEVLNELLSRFRASGRFFWMGGFWITLTSVAILVIRFGASRAAALLTALVFVQLIDVRPIALSVRENIANFNALELEGVVVNGASAILVYPPWQCDHEGTPGGKRNYELIGFFAARHKITTNNFYAARTPAYQLEYHCDYEARLTQLDPNSIYLLSPKLYMHYGHSFDGRFKCGLRLNNGMYRDEFWLCQPF